MNDPHLSVAADPAGAEPLPASPSRPRVFGWAVGAVIVLFAIPLGRLALFAATDGRYSHILLIPVISAYLAWLQRGAKPGGAPNRKLAGGLLAAGALLFAGYAVAPASLAARTEDALAATTTAFVLMFAGACCWYLGPAARRALAFPLAFLVFMVPLPHAVMSGIETFMQHGSAAVAHVLYGISGTPVFYQELKFQLPGIALYVAPECSGIRSTLVLFIVSVLTGHFFLRSAAGCVLLSIAVLPLALLRNGFRIFTIGELCTRIGPQMIDSYIHRQGGPIFFVLSLVPFLGLLVVLLRWERARLNRCLPVAAHPQPGR